MRRVLAIIIAAMGLSFTACPVGSSGPQGAPAAPAFPLTGTAPSGGTIIGAPVGASHADGPTADAGGAPTADTTSGPHAPMGDGEGIVMATPVPRVRYGTDYSQIVEQDTTPLPTLNITPNYQLNLKFVIEQPRLDSKDSWSITEPGMKVRFILAGTHIACDVPLDPWDASPVLVTDPPTPDTTTLEPHAHQLSAYLASAGKLSLYLDYDFEDQRLDCSKGFALLSDVQYAGEIAAGISLGAFNLQLPPANAANPGSPNTQTRQGFPILQ